MHTFLDLPVEILPNILQHIVKPDHLALCCLVNKIFASFAIPLLYERIYIYAWHRHGKEKVTRLFRTLSEHPDLAKWVRKLELRDFPKGLSYRESYECLTSDCLRGLANCTALRSCTWTRDRTLSTELLEVLSSRCLALKELEINGRAAGTYNPQLLPRFASLTKISLIMLCADVVATLPAWLRETGETLTSFQVLCKDTAFITDSTLGTIAPYMKRLKHLHIIGCPKVTHMGILSILLHNTQGLESLEFRGLSPAFDLSALSDNGRLLTSLTTLTLTLPRNISPNTWSQAFLKLTAHCPLAELHLSLTGGSTAPVSMNTLPAILTHSILGSHAPGLRKFSILGLRLPSEVVGNICTSCPNLESLFIVADSLELDLLVVALAQSKSLRNIHVNFLPTDGRGRIPPSEVLSVASRLGSQVRQLGFANRIYQLDRVARQDESNKVIMDVALTPYENPEVPEQFLVIRN